jgi:hypothetical protein
MEGPLTMTNKNAKGMAEGTGFVKYDTMNMMGGCVYAIPHFFIQTVSNNACF